MPLATYGVSAAVVGRTLSASLRALAAAATGRLTPDAGEALILAWAEGLLDAARVSVEVRGRAHAEAPGPVLVMSNHQSHFDIPVLFRVVPGPLRMVAKTELFRLPFFGGAMRTLGFVEIDRRDHARAVRSLEEAKRRLASGTRVWIAPEGTRSPDGRLGPFKKGGFVLAREVGVPVLPVSIWGTREALPPGVVEIRRGARVTVTVHPRIDPRDARDRDDLMARVRAAIASGLPPGMA